MKILLYNPDNGVTRNFMPHLWMFLLQSLTPPGHEVVLIDGNAQPMDEAQIAQYVRDEKIELGGDRRDDAHDREGLPHGRRDSRHGRAGRDGRSARHGNGRTRRWGAMAGRAMPTRWRWAKPMKPGRRSWTTRRAAN